MPTQTIRDFIAGKLRRSELGDQLVLSTSIGLTEDPELGSPEGRLESAAGHVDFYTQGLRASDGSAVRYDAIERVHLSPPEGGVRLVDVVLAGGAVRRIRCSDAGAAVIHATLRWIGNALLRRRIAD